jgi:dihydroneopterin triphosphate diphosphatase
MKPFIVTVHIVKMREKDVKYLLLRRCGKFLAGNWQMVAGKVNEGETATKGALRELKEETGLKPDRFYTADFVESFYLSKFDIMCHAPVFVAFIDNDQEIKLSPHEHDEFKWVTLPEALSLLEFSGQRAALQHIEEQFIKKTPNKIFQLNANE